MRQYLIGSWSNADGYDYSGEMLMGNRHGQSRRVHWNPDGSAAVQSYGDDEPKAKKISIKDRILPQAKRVQTLRGQMLDLEDEYKNTGMSIEEYSMLRDVIVCKIDRAEVLLQKALSVRPIRSETDEDSDISTPPIGFSAQPNDGYASEEYEEIGVVWIDQLSNENSLKGVLKFSCKAIRKAVQFSHKARAYWQELKEV